MNEIKKMWNEVNNKMKSNDEVRIEYYLLLLLLLSIMVPIYKCWMVGFNSAEDFIVCFDHDSY